VSVNKRFGLTLKPFEKSRNVPPIVITLPLRRDAGDLRHSFIKTAISGGEQFLAVILRIETQKVHFPPSKILIIRFNSVSGEYRIEKVKCFLQRQIPFSPLGLARYIENPLCGPLPQISHFIAHSINSRHSAGTAKVAESPGKKTSNVTGSLMLCSLVIVPIEPIGNAVSLNHAVPIVATFRPTLA
jgi:hypothetical protein